jgi:hypothetical protein
MLALCAWLAEPSDLALPWPPAGILAAQSIPQPVAIPQPVVPPAGHPAGSASGAVMTVEPERRGRTAAEPVDVFDIWLQRKLRSLFDAVADEPLPADLLRILEATPKTGGAKDMKRD